MDGIARYNLDESHGSWSLRSAKMEDWLVGLFYPLVSSNMACWKIHCVVRWFSELKPSISTGSTQLATFEYQRVHEFCQKSGKKKKLRHLLNPKCRSISSDYLEVVRRGLLVQVYRLNRGCASTMISWGSMSLNLLYGEGHSLEGHSIEFIVVPNDSR